MAKLSPVFNDQTVDVNGNPLSGAKLFTYTAGSSAKQATYTDSAGLVPQTNPIILNSLGYPTNGPIWLTEGQSTKFVLAPSTDTDPPTSPIRAIDNVQGVNDATVALNQWQASGVPPTYVSASTFTLVGDQTSDFQVGRRIQATVSLGTVYGYISASAYTTLTTVAVVLDSGALDAGLSTVSLGILTTDNTSSPILKDSNFRVSGSFDKTKRIALELDGISTATTRTLTVPDHDGTIVLIETLPGLQTAKIQPIAASVASNALTITLNPTTLDFRSSTLSSGTVNTRSVTSPISLIVPSGATLGSGDGIKAQLVVVAIDNAGTVEAAIINSYTANSLDESGVISTTAISISSDVQNVFYSNVARTNVPYRIVGIIEITEATAGTWATGPTLVQGMGGVAGNAITTKGVWQTVTRTSGVTYYNTRLVDLEISVNFTQGATGDTLLNIGSLSYCRENTASGGRGQIYATIPSGTSYSIVDSGTNSHSTVERF
jgi:hypothetical protein